MLEVCCIAKFGSLEKAVSRGLVKLSPVSGFGKCTLEGRAASWEESDTVEQDVN